MIIDCGILSLVVSEERSQYHQILKVLYQSNCPSFVRKKSLSSSKAFGGLAFLSVLLSFGMPTGSAFCLGLPTPVSYPCPSHPSRPIHKFLLLPEAWGREALSSAFVVLTYSLKSGPCPPRGHEALAFFAANQAQQSLSDILLDFSRAWQTSGLPLLPWLPT